MGRSPVHLRDQVAVAGVTLNLSHLIHTTHMVGAGVIYLKFAGGRKTLG